MLGKVLMGVGCVIFLLGMGLGLGLLGGAVYALTLDREHIIHGIVNDEFPLCTWEVAISRRVMAENESLAVSVNVTDPDPKPCRSTLALRAPGFDISPTQEEQTITVPPGQHGSLAWIVTPRKTGAYEVAVADVLTTRNLGLTVTNVLGLTSFQAQLLATLGTFFGPVFTFPWWFERWQRRKQRPPARPDDNASRPAGPAPDKPAA